MVYFLANIRGTDGRPTQIVSQREKSYSLSVLTPGLVDTPDRGLLDLLDDWDNSLARIESALESPGVGAAIKGPFEYLAPLTLPSKVIATGTNYWDHLRKDFNVQDFDKSKQDVFYFLRHADTIVGPGKTVRYPSQSAKLDWEVELVAIFGKGGRRIPVQNAMSYVAGYSVGMDLSLRDIQFNPRHRRKFDIFAGKSFDDSSPLGPFIVPAKFVNPKDLWLKLWVNGEVKQDSHTREMIWSLEEQIAEVSQHMTIRAGDVLYTGSPAGIGMVSNTFLHVGDKVDAEIEGLGKLSIEVISDPDADRAIRYG